MYRFKEIRLKNNFTQEEVANHLKISRASYTNIENGKRDPDTNTLISFALLFDVTIDFLLGLSDELKKAPASSAPLSDDEVLLLDGYRSLSKEGRAYMLQTLAMAQLSYPKNVSSSNLEENA